LTSESQTIPIISLYDNIIKSKYSGNVEDLTDSRIKLVEGQTEIEGEFAKRVWAELFEMMPGTKEDSKTNSKGTGKGELAVYWFAKQSNQLVFDNKNDVTGSADLKIQDKFYEVKAYPKTEKYISLGRFRESSGVYFKILNYVLALDIVSTVLTDSVDDKKIDTGNFCYDDLLKGFEKITKLDDNAIFTYNYLEGVGKTNEFYANQLLWNILREKVKVKPTIGGYCLNVTKDGELQWYYCSSEIFDKIVYLDVNNYSESVILARSSSLQIHTSLFNTNFNAKL